MFNTLRNRADSPTARRAALVLAALFFAAGLVYSLDRHPAVFANLSLAPVLLMLLLAVPVTLLLNGLGFYYSVRLLGKTIGFRDALETTIIGTAANMLPVPGSAIVRVSRLKMLGVGYRHGISVTLLTALIWLSASFSYSGAWLFRSDTGQWVGPVMLASGVLLLALCVLFGIFTYRKAAPLLMLVVTRIGLILVDVVRIILSARALGMGMELLQASVLSVSGVLGSAVSIVPAGLGVREGLSALIGPAIGVISTVAFLVIAVNRILGLAVVTPAALLLGLRTAEGDRR